MALYNKYRPYKLSLFCGQDHIKKILSNQVRKNKLSHSYLFTGPAGTGKTSCARVLAAMANATDGMTDEPSMSDPIVAQIISGKNNMDVFEMDAASSRGIDDIKEIRERAYMSPMQYRKKVYIIDECHQLTSEAWAALLKILEEPPSHAIFILCTTDARKVSEAIKTRCQCYDFKSVATEEIVRLLKTIIQQERIEIDDEAIRMIATCSKGSLRNALTKLDKVNDLGERITAHNVSVVLGVTNKKTISNFIGAVISADFASALQASSEALSVGVPPEDFISQVTSFLHDVLLFGAKGFDPERLGCLPEEIQVISSTKDALTKGVGPQFRKLLLRWDGILDQYAKRVTYKEQPQKLINFLFMALYYAFKEIKLVVAEKGGTA